MYDKLGRVLRIETTANDVTFFRHHRWVEHRDGTRTKKVAPVKKTIYSLPALMEIMVLRNRRDAGEIGEHGLRVAKGRLQAALGRRIRGRFTNPDNGRRRETWPEFFPRWC